MTRNKLSRRNFLKLAGTSAALAASGLPLGKMLYAAPRLQDGVLVTFAGWGNPPEQDGVAAAIEVFHELGGLTASYP